jgi:hypothetical protein
VRLPGKFLDSIYLYGSYARGDHDAESDIDIMVLAKDITPALRDGISDSASDAGLSSGYFFAPTVAAKEHFIKMSCLAPCSLSLNP